LAASVSIKISPGELIDKITILEIKLERIKESGKLENVEREHEILTASRNGTLDTSVELDGLTAELKTVNERLWDIGFCPDRRKILCRLLRAERSDKILPHSRLVADSETPPTAAPG
jgi:hypothetical protein